MKFCWTTITVSDIEKSLTFYMEILDLKLNSRKKLNEEMEIAFLGEGETKLELIWNKNNQNIKFGKDISMGFEVESIDRFTDFVKEKGIALHSGPFKPNPFIKFIYIQDPDGMKIQLVENMTPL